MTLPDDILARLSGDGVSPAFVAEKLGIGVRGASKLLQSCGTYKTKRGVYRYLDAKKTATALGRMCIASERTGVAFGGARDAV